VARPQKTYFAPWLNEYITRAAYCNRVKYIICFGLKVGFDQVPFRAAMDCCNLVDGRGDDWFD